MSFGGFISGFVPMLRLGSFNFSINIAVFQEMSRSSEYRWPGQERFGQMPALQFTGIGDETITLPGVIFPQYKGSANAMEKIRAMAAAGEPYLLLDAQGKIYGRWVITRVDETRSVFAAFAMPRKIEFSVTLQRFDGDGINLLRPLLDSAITAARDAINI